MGRIFLTSDLHFGHDREFIWGARGFNSIWEMNDAYVKRWNETITEDDDVYVLGDLMLGSTDNIKYIKQLRGRIHIVFGNHDTTTRRELYNNCHNVVEAEWALMLDYKKHHFYMTHFPCLTGNLEKESLKQMTLNLFGHTHQNGNFYEDRPYMYHVGVDSHNGYPVLLDEIIEEMYAKVKECKGFLGNEDIDQVHSSKESDVYKVIKATVDNWPNWKKKFYNECIATSLHAKKLELTPRCSKCVYEGSCSYDDSDGNCPKYKRDPPDGGFYG